MSPGTSKRLDYKESEQVACHRFGVESIMGQDGLCEIDDRATPAEWADFYIQHFETMDHIFLASGIDAMLTRLVHAEDRSGMDTVRKALELAQTEPWACSMLDIHLKDTGDFPGEAFVVELITSTVDLKLVQEQVAALRRPPHQGA